MDSIVFARTEKGRVAQEKIISAATRLFSTKGFAGTNVADVCSEADAAVGSFYRYFPDKEAVLDVIVKGLSIGINLRFKNLQKCADLRESVFTATTAFFDFVSENLDAYQVLRESEFVCGGAKSFYNTYSGILRAYLTGLPAAGADIVIYSIIGAQSFIVMKELIWGRKKIPAAAADIVAHIVESGIGGNVPVDIEQCIGSFSSIRVNDVRIAPGARRAILSAAEGVFGKYGFIEAQVSDICRKADTSIGTFYAHFPSKEIAFRELTLLLRDELIRHAAIFSKGRHSRIEIELAALYGFFRFIEQHIYGYRIMREAEFVNFALAADYYLFLHENYSRGMREGAKDGEFITGDYDMLALILMGMGHMLGLRYIVWEKDGIDGCLFQNIAGYMLNGISTLKGERI